MFVPFAQSADLSIHKETCKEIGFKEGTEPYGNCVLELYKRYRVDNEMKVNTQEIQRQKDEARQKEIREENRLRRDRRKAERERLEIDRQRLELERRRQAEIEEQNRMERSRRRGAAISGVLNSLNKSLYPAPGPTVDIDPPSTTTCYMNGNQLQCY